MDQPYQQNPQDPQDPQDPTENSEQAQPPQPPPPFSCTFSPNIPELLQQMNASLAISTYQAGKVILISPKNRDELIQLPRNFAKPMGIAVKGQKMAIATLDEVIILGNAQGLAKNYPRQPNIYDSFYVPRASYFTGEVDLHDLEWGNDGLWGVNTSFSCLSIINDDFSFTPKWQPPFISKLAPEDRCHLNGVAFVDGEPKYVTALGATDTKNGWRKNKATGGILMDIESNETILKGLSMPHSPRVYNDNLYVLLSGTGEIVRVNTKTRKYDILKEMSGFTRGMDQYGDYLFIALSKLRTTSKAFQDLPISKKSVFAGIVIIYLPSASTVGYIKYESSVDEIFDVRVLPGTTRPGLLSTMRPDYKMAISIPESSFWAAPKKPKENTEPENTDKS